MTPNSKTISSSYEDYLIEVEKYILTLREPIARKIRRIEKSTRIFTEKIYGYLPTAGEMKWPVLKLYFGGLGYGR